MIRVACIGNSHLAAFKEAREEIEGRYPDVRLQFFGLPNPVFFRSKRVDGTALKTEHPVDDSLDQLINPDAPHALPLDRFDVVLLTSHSFYLSHFFKGMAGLDLLGYPQSNERTPLTSLPCALDMIRDGAQHYAARIRRFFPNLPNLVVIQAPFPSSEAVRISTDLAQISTHPACKILFDGYQRVLAETCVNEGLHFSPAPNEVLKQPFFTKAEYARAKGLADPDAATLSDHIHMNTRYAADVFAVFHTNVLTASV
ncbi:MAG: hypothetical protein AAFZ99_09965 [Pseudomonadota bacterium]